MLTSNIGARLITENRAPLGFGGARSEGEELHERVMEELRATFRPEFLNRVDETIVFRRLGGDELYAITRQLLAEVEGRFRALGLTLCVPEETLRFLADSGSDARYGARPLRRAVQRAIEDAAAELLLSGRVRPGDRLEARLENGAVTLQKS